MLKIISEGIIPVFFNGKPFVLPLLITGYVVCAIIAYLCGSLNFAMIISKKKSE